MKMSLADQDDMGLFIWEWVDGIRVASVRVAAVRVDGIRVDGSVFSRIEHY